MGLPLKLGVVSATVLSTAVMFKLISPFIMNLSVSDFPIIWSSLITWLKPPYLYVVINGIIITIVASSRLQSKVDGSHDSLSSFSTRAEPVKVVHPVELPPVHVHEQELSFHGDVLETEPVDIAVAGYNSEAKFVDVPVAEFSTPKFIDETLDEDMKIAKEAYEEIKKNRVNNSLISKSAWSPSEIKQVGLSFPTEKPPASARFSRRKPTKATPEGGRTLGVAKPKRQDTLETTWKTITEGRSVPLTRHLRKSDTWETHGQSRENRHTDEFVTERMTKSDTFDVNRSRKPVKPVKPPPAPSKLSRSGGSGRLKKEPSVGQEELNRRVEAFINKFNEDMRLQRQESMNRYMEMINRGAH
ncbi:hypothetical protein HanXRQr2_Chr11g0477661 [Helianthus annuus]|uniref:DUF4408 domain-containing protein n=1 Tax=Helianthus annuus TaxID=4232 RepID=A0A251T9N0_HELAN|nr:uncharacterized protein LOC110889819 [Helianthus annuus]KAF5780937.1 hypothetical protein HanXRQr2_Chr11g0477661 [Helianthus annuus]KAJ0508212.1 hypothetical protein HanIR_Chr11g0514751 [Helianthus annuus]KAJ0516510.1 hypothetical protein HanHA89_Chr11g0414641 [Helianthus annuus]KAJ0684513.1 hypothetical protein HanLR1_Chr11g0392011 [Helianthus annuus]KAJ0874127.1 hypothetical protein HanPSC8_Chr11g0460461 [Helianthus annuus]